MYQLYTQNFFDKQPKKSRSLQSNPPRECVPHTRGCLIDGLPFQLLTSLKLAAFRRPPMSFESVSSNKVKTLNNKLFLLQHPNHKQKSYGALSQKLHCRWHVLFHRQTRRPEIAPACRTYRLIACGLCGCAKTISL